MTQANWVGCESTPEGNEAYRNGRCKKCLTRPYQAGSTMCAECWPLSKPSMTYWQRMMGNVTDEQRMTARAASNTRQANHENHGDADYQIATSKAGNQGHYEFLIACFAFINNFGGPGPDLKLRRGGTRDSGLRITLGDKQFVVIPKANAYKGIDQRLRVPVGTVTSDAIYVAARYYEQGDDVELVGWEYARVLVEHNDLRRFKSQNNYTLPYTMLRSMGDLR